MLTFYMTHTFSAATFLMLLSRTAGDWFTKLIIPSLLAAVRNLGWKMAKTQTSACVKDSPGQSPSPAPDLHAFSCPASRTWQRNLLKEESTGETAKWFEIISQNLFFFSFKVKAVTPWGWDFIKRWEICYEWFKAPKSTETQIHCPWSSTIRVFIQPPSPRTHKWRTSSELSTRANSQEHLCEGDFSRRMKKQCNDTPIPGRY